MAWLRNELVEVLRPFWALLVLRRREMGWPNPASVLRYALGGVLLLAALLKTESVLFAGDDIPQRVLIPLVIVVEGVLALWLFSGRFVFHSWWMTVACFSVFGGVSTHQAFIGEASCGCFGRVTVPPLLTAGVDAVTTAALIWLGPEAKPAHGHGIGLTGSWVAAASLFLLGAFIAQPLRVYSAVTVTNPATVVLEPASWQGKVFPLLSEIDIGPELATGDWLVVLYNYACPACQDILRQVDVRRSEFADRRMRVALIEVPPYQDSDDVDDDDGRVIAFGKLSDRKQWFVNTPTFVRLSQGYVKPRNQEEDSLVSIGRE